MEPTPDPRPDQDEAADSPPASEAEASPEADAGEAGAEASPEADAGEAEAEASAAEAPEGEASEGSEGEASKGEASEGEAPQPAPAATEAAPSLAQRERALEASATMVSLVERGVKPYVFDPVAVTTPIRIALALIYFHFGFLKFFPDLSAAEMLATQTILRMRLGIGATDALALLAVFECLIGVAFVLRVHMKYLFPVFIAHMLGTLAPLVLLPEIAFKFAPFAPTLEGQYILKNAVVIAAGWTLYRADQARDPQRQVLGPQQGPSSHIKVA